MIELLESEGMVPHHLMPKFKKSPIEEKTKKLNDGKKVDIKLKPLEDKEKSNIESW